MRRILIILCLLAACVAVSWYSIRYVGGVNEFVEASVVRARGALDGGDKAALAHELAALSAYWDGAEGRLVHFVRHTGVDDITKSVARLPALAAGGDDAELAATLDSIRVQMRRVSEGERIAAGNLL